MKVRINSRYMYVPVPMDVLFPPINGDNLKPGDVVRVINRQGAPKANVMNHCYIESVPDCEFLGLVHINSLTPIRRKK